MTDRKVRHLFKIKKGKLVSIASRKRINLDLPAADKSVKFRMMSSLTLWMYTERKKTRLKPHLLPD